MSITAETPGTSPAGVLAEAVAAVRGLADILWSARSDDELVEVVGQVQQLTSVLAAVEADAVAEADARDLAKQRLHYGSTGDWLTHAGGLRRGEGKRRVVRARALTGPLTRTRDGLWSPGRSHRSRPTSSSGPSPTCRPVTWSADAGRRSCCVRPGAWMPPSWPGPAGTWPRWSTPTPSTADSKPPWSVRNVPRT